MYSSIEDEPISPIPAPLATADPSLPLMLRLFFIPTGGDDWDVQGEAGSRLRIVHANFY